MWRLPLFAFVWLVYAALVLPLIVIGIPLIAVLALFYRHTTLYGPSRHFSADERDILTWRWRWIDALFGNDEDGVDGLPTSVSTPPFPIVMERQAWWHTKTYSWPQWRRIFVWSALRNSNANLRFLPFFGLKIDPSRVRAIPGKSFGHDWTLVWQGPRASFRWYWSSGRCLWVGWKVKPSDRWWVWTHSPVSSLPSSDSRAPGVGFAFQPYGSV